MGHAYNSVASPVGALKVVASNCGISVILLEDDDPKRVSGLGPSSWTLTTPCCRRRSASWPPTLRERHQASADPLAAHDDENLLDQRSSCSRIASNGVTSSMVKG